MHITVLDSIYKTVLLLVTLIDAPSIDSYAREYLSIIVNMYYLSTCSSHIVMMTDESIYMDFVQCELNSLSW